MERNERGYLNQKGNRYFIKIGASTNFNSGFKTKEQFESWIKEEFKKHGLDWRTGYSWKYRAFSKVFNLVDKYGKPPKKLTEKSNLKEEEGK